MQKKAPGVENAFKPYTQYEIDLILSMIPNKKNTQLLAKSLRRNFPAIATIYHMAYSGRWLKESLGQMKEGQDNVVTKIALAKKKYDIYVGHEPS